MKNIQSIWVFALFLGLGLWACKKSDNPSPPTNPDEQLLVSVTWRGEGFYINGRKQPNMPPFTIRFLPEVAGLKGVAINGIPGGTWRLNSTTTPKLLTIFYPSPTFAIENGNAVGTSSATFSLTAFSNTNLNLTSGVATSFFGIITIDADSELRLIPQ